MRKVPHKLYWADLRSCGVDSTCLLEIPQYYHIFNIYLRFHNTWVPWNLMWTQRIPPTGVELAADGIIVSQYFIFLHHIVPHIIPVPRARVLDAEQSLNMTKANNHYCLLNYFSDILNQCMLTRKFPFCLQSITKCSTACMAMLCCRSCTLCKWLNITHSPYMILKLKLS